MPAKIVKAGKRNKRMGWIPDLPDHRDYISSPPVLKALPDQISLRAEMPGVYNQSDIGSCTANAVAAAVQYQQIKQGNPEGKITPSRLFIYYEERKIENTIDSDSGAFLRDGMKVVKNVGAPPETDWPYKIDKFAVQPPNKAYVDALNYQTLKYARVYRTSYQLRSHLASNRPVIFGFTVYNSFWDSAGKPPYICAMPGNEGVAGGHAVVAIGYKANNVGQILYYVRNSWGASWGDGGHFWMPEAYLLNPDLSSDFWCITLEE